jgi:hypothetical protein
MHAETGGTIKGTWRSDQHVARPRPGSKIGELYDLFKANEGIPIQLTISHSKHHRLRPLIDTYGLDIRCIRRGTWVLAGEWFGSEYVDYIARHIEERSRA